MSAVIQQKLTKGLHLGFHKGDKKSQHGICNNCKSAHFYRQVKLGRGYFFHTILKAILTLFYSLFLMFEDLVATVARGNLCMLHFKCQFLDQEILLTVILVLVMSCLDYCNVLHMRAVFEEYFKVTASPECTGISCYWYFS